MKVGDIVEAHRGERGIVLGIELLYPGNKYSPPRNVSVRWFDRVPRYVSGREYCHVAGIKRVISSASR